MRCASTLLLLLLVAAAAPDLSTPKSAAKSLYNAISAGDRDAVEQCFFAGDEEQKKLASAMADFIVAGKKLGDAARDKFGKAGDPIGRGMLDPADISHLDRATVDEDGDHAVIHVPDQPRPMSFRKQDGQWKLVVTDFGGAAPGNIAKQTALVRMLAGAVSASAADVAAGKFKTPEEATTSIQQSLHQVMLSFYRPATTRSTTLPTTATTQR